MGGGIFLFTLPSDKMSIRILITLACLLLPVCSTDVPIKSRVYANRMSIPALRNMMDQVMLQVEESNAIQDEKLRLQTQGKVRDQIDKIIKLIKENIFPEIKKDFN